MKSYTYLILLVLLIVLFDCVAQFCLKKYAKHSTLHWFLIGALIYGGIAFLLALTFNHQKLALVHVTWGGLSAIVLSIMAYFMFQERLSKIQIAGIVIILIGLLMLHL
jgi:multidrug transporter EmrE-like cation transporter